MAGLLDLLSFLKQKQDQNIAGNLLGAEPEAVPGAGEGLSPMSAQALQNYGQDWARFGKGMATGAVGMPGDLVSLGRGLFSAMTPQPQQTRLDALLTGMQKPTLLPTTQDVSKAVDPYLPQFMAGESAPQTIGEIAAPAGLIGKVAKEAAPLVAKGIEALPKDLPVGASVKPVVNAPVSDIGMYSALEEAGLNLQRNKGPGQAFLNDLLKAPNVKQEEVKWIGLDDYLKDKPNATKQDVQDFIQNNRVDVQEVTLGGNMPKQENMLSINDIRVEPMGDKGRWFIESPTGSVTFTSGTEQEAKEFGLRYFNGHIAERNRIAVKEADDTKFGTYTLPGGKNYREILLTMPFKEPAMPKGYEVTSVQYDDGTYRYFANTPTTRSSAYKTEADAMAELQRKVQGLKGFRENQQAYKSSHWDQPNVLAHLRVNDRVDADGKKMLLVEEVQSDWHQAGRDKGYKNLSNNLPSGYLAKQDFDSPGNPWGVVNESGEWVTSGFHKSKDSATSEVINKLNAGKVPDAPFKDNWYQLALKRAIKYAADNGYDRIGLTTGARQAERYDLSKQVDYIDYRKSSDGTFELGIADKHGDAVDLPKARYTAEELPSLVGKEIADKIVKGEGQSGGGRMTLRGIDLKVGGEGMKKYYDEIYPQFLAKYGKKWGAKVGETTINLQKDLEGFMPRKDMQIEPVRYIDITPEMKESVKKGQPLFAAVPALPVGSGLMDQMGEKKKTKAKNPRSLMESF